MVKIKGKILAFDTETTGLWPWPLDSRKALGLAPDRPFAFSVSNLDGDTAFRRCKVDPKTRQVQWNERDLKWIKDVVFDPSMTVVMHNAPFDIVMTQMLGFIWRCRWLDTKIMAHTANPIEETYSLKPLSRKYLGIKDDDQVALKADLQRARREAKAKGWAIATKESHGDKPAEADYWLCKPELLEQYAVQDAVRTALLYQMYEGIIGENLDAGGKLCEILDWEMMLQRTVMRGERRGVHYRTQASAELRRFYEKYMRDQKREMKRLGYADLNPMSRKHLEGIFLEEREYTTVKETKKGNPKMDAEQLMAWARGSAAGADVDGDGDDGDQLARAIIEYKAAHKVIEYLDAYDYFSCTDDEGITLIHPRWNQTGARTGRFSCADPNLMQIASAETSRRHSRIRARQRECFGPAPGRIWYTPDYSQIEVWIFAFAAKEETMMKALLSGEDFHLATARAAWGKRKDFCTCGKGAMAPRKEHAHGCLINWWRQRAKMILFSKLFGGGIGKIAELIRCAYEEAKGFVADFEERLPGVPRYMERVVNQVHRTGVLVNLFGREYPIPKDRAYKAVNYMVQGSAAEVMKRSMVRLNDMLLEDWPDTYVIGTVHDELWLDLPMDLHSKQLMRGMVACMQADQDTLKFPVPLPVTVKVVRQHLSDPREVKL